MQTPERSGQPADLRQPAKAGLDQARVDVLLSLDDVQEPRRVPTARVRESVAPCRFSGAQ
jgi:hypothetical protein